MLKMGCLYYLLFLHLVLSTVSGQESVDFITLHASSSHTSIGNNKPVAISVQNELLINISSNVLAAENWVRTHVLAHYPSTNITAIVVGHTLLCNKNGNFNLILPSIKNIYYSLSRWGLQNEIKVSASFGSSCLDSNSEFYRDDLGNRLVKPLLEVLQEINSPYLVNAPSGNVEFSVYAHSNAIKKIGFLGVVKINVVVDKLVEVKQTSRKLSFVDSDVVYPPLPPLVGHVSPPPSLLPFAPQPSPEVAHPGSPHYGPHLPPCAPPSDGGGVAKPPRGRGRVHGGLWCVAKPSVPSETLQESLDFACGEGGADCEEIQPSGNCYFPDTTIAHASYAFNSYWQKTKGNGGICGFGGTAMLINSDPSYQHCRFNLA